MRAARAPTRQDLIDLLSEAITEFNRTRVEILKKALAGPGGGAAVEKLEREYDALRDARAELRERQLAENDDAYRELAVRASAETKALKKVIADLAAVSQIISALATVVDIIGRIVLVAGL